MPTITANGTTLYYELRGDGPPLMFISGGPGDAGFWPEVADALADEYTVRELRPSRQLAQPPPGELDRGAGRRAGRRRRRAARGARSRPAVVHGHSAGGIILANLALRRPDVLRGAVFHEPAFVVTPGAQETFAGLQERLGDAMAQGGPSGAMEMFLRWADGDAGYESLDPDFRDRMLGDGEVLFGHRDEIGH